MAVGGICIRALLAQDGSAQADAGAILIAEGIALLRALAQSWGVKT